MLTGVITGIIGQDGAYSSVTATQKQLAWCYGAEQWIARDLNGSAYRRPSRRHYKRKAEGELEARLVALRCSEPPDGHCRWPLRLLADRAVELEYVDSLSYETVRRVLKKNEIKPW